MSERLGSFRNPARRFLSSLRGPLAAVLIILFPLGALAAPLPPPVFSTAGSPVVLRARSGIAIDQAVLVLRATRERWTVPAQAVTGGASVNLPSNLPPGYYDARYLTADGTLTGVTRGALSILASEDFLRVVHITDIHADLPQSLTALAQAVDRINALDPDLVIDTGDNDTYPDQVTANQVRALLSRIHAPILYCPGNHDHYSFTVFLSTYSNRSWYSVRAGRFRFISLDTGDSFSSATHQGQGLSQSQLDWLARTLDSSAGEVVVEFMHFSPVVAGDDFIAGKARFLRLTANHGVAAVLAGHRHTDGIYDLSGRTTTFAQANGTVAVHTTTLSPNAVRGDPAGFRLLDFTLAGVSSKSPPTSIPLSATLSAPLYPLAVP